MYPKEPSTLLKCFCSVLPRSGLALDVACGCGQNARFLATRGLQTVGIDLSWKALAAGRELISGSSAKIDYVQADLTSFTLPSNAFSVVICFKYRDPNLYSSLRAALRPGGLLIYETYTCEHLHYGLRPQNPAHLLGRQELLRAFGDWEIIFYREIWTGRGVSSLVARKPFLSRDTDSFGSLQYN